MLQIFVLYHSDWHVLNFFFALWIWAVTEKLYWLALVQSGCFCKRRPNSTQLKIVIFQRATWNQWTIPKIHALSIALWSSLELQFRYLQRPLKYRQQRTNFHFHNGGSNIWGCMWIKILKCEHSNESYWAVFSCCTIYYGSEGGSNIDSVNELLKCRHSVLLLLCCTRWFELLSLCVKS